MLRFRDGDERAFQHLFDRYRKKIINYCYRFHPDRDVAEELAQEVFLRVYRAAPRYRPDARFSTWLFRIATNICLNELRKPRYQVKSESLDEPVSGDSDGMTREIEDRDRPGPDDAYETREKMEQLQRALSKLPEKQRAAILLHSREGFSYEEIAKQLGRSESSVKSLLHRARQGLKKVLGHQSR